MAHFIPTLRTASRATYIPPAMRRKSDIPASTGNPAPAADFRTVLKNESVPAAAGTASPPGTIGPVTPWPPAAVVTPPAAVTSPMAPTAQSLFGANPWSTGAGGTGPTDSYSYNHYYFAT